MHEKDLALDNLQLLICHETSLNQLNWKYTVKADFKN